MNSTEKNERRYVIVDKPVPKSKKKWLANVSMVTVHDNENDSEFATVVNTKERIVNDVIKRLSYATFPDGTSEILKIEDMETVKRTDNIEVGDIVRLFNSSPYVYI